MLTDQQLPETAELFKRKEELIEKIIQHPLDFTHAEFIDLVNLGTAKEFKKDNIELNFDDLRKMIIRIFDINETTLKLQSDATSGTMGFMNKRSTKLRHKGYYRRIHEGFRDLESKEKKVIVAEGDSWFQFPLFIKDIIDWLSDEPDYAVYSIAYGGDWFTNILYDEKYIEELSIHKPEVFLISGGGNDFVGSNRLAIMVEGNCKCERRKQNSEIHDDLLSKESSKVQDEINRGYDFITEPFYSFLWTIKAQYWKLFCRLTDPSGKFTDMKIITQGYDYVIPTFDAKWKKWYKLQPIVNKGIGSGKWLKRPLMIKGIKNEKDGECIMKALIFEINCMFSELALTKEFVNVFHIDCRGVAQGPDDWWDEIHLHSEGFQKIAMAYEHCINNEFKEKIVKVVDVIETI